MTNFKEPLVSVIVPVYNVSAYLPCCLESLLKQTLKEIEILCIDDASSDDSAELVQSFADRDPRVRLLQQEHRGVSAARNLGILHSRGKYAVFVDSDDWLDTNMLKRLVDQAEAKVADVVICSAIVHDEVCSRKDYRRHHTLQSALSVKNVQWICTGSCSDIWSLQDMPGCWPFIWNKLIRSELLRESGILFPEGLALGEDGVFLQILFQYARRIAFVPEALYHYRYQRRDSATVRLYEDTATRFRQHICVVETLFQMLSQRKLLELNGEYALRWTLRFLYGDFVRLHSTDRRSASLKLKKGFMGRSAACYSVTLSKIEKRRLEDMLNSEKVYPEARRKFNIVRLKIENRLIRLFYAE